MHSAQGAMEVYRTVPALTRFPGPPYLGQNFEDLHAGQLLTSVSCRIRMRPSLRHSRLKSGEEPRLKTLCSNGRRDPVVSVVKLIDGLADPYPTVWRQAIKALEPIAILPERAQDLLRNIVLKCGWTGCRQPRNPVKLAQNHTAVDSLKCRRTAPALQKSIEPPSSCDDPPSSGPSPVA